jgi:hypothetical protein
MSMSFPLPGSPSDLTTQPDGTDAYAALSLDEPGRKAIVETKATCPFIGGAITDGALSVRNAVAKPMASVEDIRQLGNAGGGDLGDLLAVFAAGNHAHMHDRTGVIAETAPLGLFFLDFPGSQGSHAGHSGILQGDPKVRDSGRLSRSDLARLTQRATDGWIKRSDVGHFIAENLIKDPNAHAFGANVAKLLAKDLSEFASTIGPFWKNKLFGSDAETAAAHRDADEKLTKLLGEDHLLGSAGEFGLLFAFFAQRRGAQEIDGEPAISVRDIEWMFVDKHLPSGWETWPKTRVDWVKNTVALAVSAATAYHKLKRAV